MILHLPPGLRGSIAISLMVINTVIFAVPVHVLALTKILIRNEAWQRTCARALMNTVNCWIWGILSALKITQDTTYDIRGIEGLSRDQWYFVNCNHQSWADILVLLVSFHGHIPFFKFFLKKQLFWIPLLGTSWWALDYPFMERFSKSYLQANPHMKGKDLETTRKACERYRHTPVSILNFIEGTRFTREKHHKQKSPYRYLLRPKAGGFAYALAAMNGRIENIIDVTIMYPKAPFDFWTYLCGQIPHIAVRVRKLPVPHDILTGDYSNDQAFKNRFQSWVSGLWQEKDDLIEDHRNKREMRVSKDQHIDTLL
ncbi:MAG TPA: acyltransferase [Deltaproteobacteria bacterium]|nr:acyltransferase [Deltaproteobacteria bacterium]HPJ93179.1 acyltransferase [Deltaproteobacteria bacterium]HPR50843.1 acyltransferase [Deltaproteobacteria bacterium]